MKQEQLQDMLTTCGKFQATIGSTQSECLDTLSCPTSLCTSARCLSRVSVNQKKQINVWIVDFKCTYSRSKKCKIQYIQDIQDISLILNWEGGWL